MTPVSRRIALALARLALLGAACGVASADWYFPAGDTAVSSNGSAVTTQVVWRSRLLALPGTNDTMDVRLVGTARGGKPVTVTSAAGVWMRCALTPRVRLARLAGSVTVRLGTVYTPAGGTARVKVQTVVLPSLKPPVTG